MDHFHYKNGELHAEEVALAAIAAQVGTPFYCYSSATLARHYQVFADAFSGMNAKICYAVKANGNLAVIRTLAKLGCGADVVSEGEIRLALAAGVKPDDIVFSGVAKTADEMRYALTQKIFQFNVESAPELELLNDVAKSLGTKAPIALRVNPDVVPLTHSKISTGQKESKFGVPIEQAAGLYARARALAYIRVQGVSVHIGSQLVNLAPFAAAFDRVAAFVRELRAQGVTIDTLDLGGGLGVPYGHQAPPPLPEEYARIVKDKTQGLDCRLVFEPGRLIAANAGVLVTQVIYVKENIHEAGDTRRFIILDAGMNDLLRPALYGAHHDIVPVKQNADAPSELADVVGPVCETSDIFATQRLLRIPNAGDLMAFRSAGAYGAAMASTYNARPLVAEVMVKGAEFAVVRPRQTYEEILGQYRLPGWL